MIEAQAVDGPRKGELLEAGPRGVIGFMVIYGHRRIFETGRYNLRIPADGLGRPWLEWDDWPMTIDEAYLIADQWGMA